MATLKPTTPLHAPGVTVSYLMEGDVETSNTTARPQQETAETAIASASEKRTKNAYFSPAKAMAVSPPHGRQRAKATMVSDNWASWPTGSGRGTCER